MAEDLPSEVLEYFREQGRLGGSKGGKVRAQKLSAGKRKEIARKAGLASAAARAKAKAEQSTDRPPAKKTKPAAGKKKPKAPK